MSSVRLLSGRRRLTTDEAALRIYEALDTPVSLSCYLLLKNGEVSQLVQKSISAKDYCLIPTLGLFHKESLAEDVRALAERFGRDYQAVSLLSKIDREIGIDKKAAALLRWREAEESNRLTNLRLGFYNDGITGGSRHPEYRPFAEHMHRARKIIERILGPFSWRDAARHFDFGPGVTRQTRGNSVDLSRKYAGSPAVSPQAISLAAHAIGLTPSWFESLTGLSPVGPCCYLGVVADDAASVSFVPKNAKTLRSIGIEPLMNIYLQKGIGAVIRHRLRRVGINLDDQSTNQAGAFLASIGNGFVTLDLSNASDTVSSGLVRDLLPTDWFEHLDSLRSRISEIEGTRVLNQKFSSMGNGFTFELESLIFYALARATEELHDTSHEVLVYGDDLVVHHHTAEGLIPLLNFCGFTVNQAKSFVDGYFYESCGRDFFLGYDVRPFFIRKDLKDVEDFFLLYNQCSWVSRNCDSPYRTNLYESVLGRVYHSVRASYRFDVPPHWGEDTGFQRFFDEVTPSWYTRRGWGIYRFPYWQAVPNSVKRWGKSLLAAKLSKMPGSTQTPLDDYPQGSSDMRRLRGVEFALFPPNARQGNVVAVREDRVQRRRIAVGYTHSWQ